jgi:hypothetical protein
MTTTNPSNNFGSKTPSTSINLRKHSFQLATPLPLWFFRSDSNISNDPIAINLSQLFSYLQNWKEDTQAIISSKKSIKRKR